MSYDFEVVGWEDWNGNQHREAPYEDQLPDIAGVFVRFYDPDTNEPDHYSWLYVDPPAPGEEWDWDDWYDLITGVLTDHGYDMA